MDDADDGPILCLANPRFLMENSSVKTRIEGLLLLEAGLPDISVFIASTLTVSNYVSHCHHQAWFLKADTVFDFLETWMWNSAWKQKFKWEKFLWRAVLEKRKRRERISFFLVLYGIISMKVKAAILLGTKLSYWQNRKSKNYPPGKESLLGKRGPANWRCGNDSFPHSSLLLWGPWCFSPLAS